MKNTISGLYMPRLSVPLPQELLLRFYLLHSYLENSCPPSSHLITTASSFNTIYSPVNPPPFLLHLILLLLIFILEGERRRGGAAEKNFMLWILKIQRSTTISSNSTYSSHLLFFVLLQLDIFFSLFLTYIMVYLLQAIFQRHIR